eukprot:1247359-Amphidinium_carterae.1
MPADITQNCGGKSWFCVCMCTCALLVYSLRPAMPVILSVGLRDWALDSLEGQVRMRRQMQANKPPRMCGWARLSDGCKKQVHGAMAMSKMGSSQVTSVQTSNSKSLLDP